MFFALRAHHMDQALLRLTRGRLTITGLMGWPIIELITVGAKTGELRSMPLIGVIDHEKIVVIASSFGRAHSPGWYYNLKAHPECEVLLKGRSAKYIARETAGDEYQHYWQLAVSYYAGYEKYKERAAPRHIPVMLLEPQK